VPSIGAPYRGVDGGCRSLVLSWWRLTRATGVVATALLVAAGVSGFGATSRLLGGRPPVWWRDLHNALGGLAAVFLVAHVAAALIDPTAGVPLAAAVVPLVAPVARWSLAFGAVAADLLVAVVATSWPRRRLGRRAWRAVHLSSLAALGLALLHGVQLGSDAGRPPYRAGVVALVGVATYAAALRVVGLASRARARAR
jgi:sulfoxide reductase heme-binding subunit YedZ